MLVELCVALVREGQEPEDLIELLRRRLCALVEWQPERIEQRVERVPPLRAHSRGRSAGKRITSRIASLPVSAIVIRSIPTPHPPVGGMPYESAPTRCRASCPHRPLRASRGALARHATTLRGSRAPRRT